MIALLTFSKKQSCRFREMPHRGRPVAGDVRELIIPFGAGGYIIRYRVRDQTVVIARIFHSLEDRPLA
ncbi:MAG: type II toxin-antitoxin system RelE/ParE family toxin [Caulobacter sp.]|nr:type II toxin-antitoxin system RelE/ParE family toxin [Caulobacter sp.]